MSDNKVAATFSGADPDAGLVRDIDDRDAVGSQRIRGWTIRGSYATDRPNIFVYRPDGTLYSKHSVEGYKIWTYIAHFDEFLAMVEEQLEREATRPNINEPDVSDG